MILPIYVYGQPVLRQEAQDITPDYPNLKELIQNMHETMGRADGVGLAAPQIGLPIRLVVIDLDVMSDEYPELKEFRHAYINPRILETAGEEVSMEEGCLASSEARRLADREGVEINTYSIIYDAIDDIKSAMVGMLDKVKKEIITGQVEVKQVFKVSKVGTIAGGLVTEGKVHAKDKA